MIKILTTSILATSILAMAVAGLAGAGNSETSEKPQAIYLLMGQSNMSGRGDVAQLPKAVLIPDASIRVYGNDGVWRVAQEPLDSAAGQIDPVSSDADKAGVGPGLSFARTLKTRHRTIGLVPCAKGGSALKEWVPDQARTTLYGSCLARAREASASGKIVGILWYQGETDAGTVEAARLWPDRMAVLIGQMRTDLQTPCLPWVVVGLSDKPNPKVWKGDYPGWADIQAAQSQLPKGLAHVGHVSAAGLPKNADTIHLSTPAQLRLGPQLAKVMLRLEKTSQGCPS